MRGGEGDEGTAPIAAFPTAGPRSAAPLPTLSSSTPRWPMTRVVPSLACTGRGTAARARGGARRRSSRTDRSSAAAAPAAGGTPSTKTTRATRSTCGRGPSLPAGAFPLDTGSGPYPCTLQVLNRDLAADLWKYSSIATAAKWPLANQPKSPCPTLKVRSSRQSSRLRRSLTPAAPLSCSSAHGRWLAPSPARSTPRRRPSA